VTISTEFSAAKSQLVTEARARASDGISAVLCSPRRSRIAPLSKIETSPSVSQGTCAKG